MYWKRKFDVVKVSTNVPDERNGVLKFLQEQHAVTRSLLCNFNDPTEGIAAFGTDWSGGAPYTVRLSPDGDILYRAQGRHPPVGGAAHDSEYLPDDRDIGTHLLDQFILEGSRS